MPWVRGQFTNCSSAMRGFAICITTKCFSTFHIFFFFFLKKITERFARKTTSPRFSHSLWLSCKSSQAVQIRCHIVHRGADMDALASDYPWCVFISYHNCKYFFSSCRRKTRQKGNLAMNSLKNRMNLKRRPNKLQLETKVLFWQAQEKKAWPTERLSSVLCQLCLVWQLLTSSIIFIKSHLPSGFTVASVRHGGVHECQLMSKLILTVCAAYKSGVLFYLSRVDMGSVTLEHWRILLSLQMSNKRASRLRESTVQQVWNKVFIVWYCLSKW